MGLDVGEIGFGRDLRLDLKMFAARSLGRFAAAAAADLEFSPATAMVSCIKSLEEERVKIEVFKRELPLCGRLLTDVIEVLKEEAGKGKSDKSEDEQRAAEDDGDDKRKWMSTAQLWVDNRSHGDDNRSHGDAGSEKQSFSAEAQSCRPGFGPFKTVGHGAPAFAPPCLRREEKTGVAGLPDLSLLSPQSAHMQAAIASTDRDDRRMVVGSGFAGAPAMWAPPITSPYPTFALQPPQLPQPQPQPQPEPQPQQEPQPQGQQQGRKARRCWSPELHRQFVTALHQLGGAQVATPKQIRELMKVDGLTNDEVKSHLQKYRLHNRRAPGSAVVNQPIVLVGGLWLSQEQSSSQSGSPQGPLQFSTSGVAVSSAGTTVSCEEEDGRSESYDWK